MTKLCWLCGKPRKPEGRCKFCRAPLLKPAGWISTTYEDEQDPLHPIEKSKTSATPQNSIEKKPTKRYTTLTLERSTLTILKNLRNRLPYSVSCKSMDDLLLALVKREEHPT